MAFVPGFQNLNEVFRIFPPDGGREDVWLQVSPTEGLRYADGRSLLSPNTKPFLVLVLLLRNAIQDPDRFVTKKDLVREVWEGQHLAEGTLDGTISDLRAALGRKQLWIKCVPRVGYQFVARFERVEATAPQLRSPRGGGVRGSPAWSRPTATL